MFRRQRPEWPALQAEEGQFSHVISKSTQGIGVGRENLGGGVSASEVIPIQSERPPWAQSRPFFDQRAGGASAFDQAITLHRFPQGGTGEGAKNSGILAVAIALIATGKLSATLAATCNLSADAAAHLERGGKSLPDARQM